MKFTVTKEDLEKAKKEAVEGTGNYACHCLLAQTLNRSTFGVKQVTYYSILNGDCDIIADIPVKLRNDIIVPFDHQLYDEIEKILPYEFEMKFF